MKKIKVLTSLVGLSGLTAGLVPVITSCSSTELEMEFTSKAKEKNFTNDSRSVSYTFKVTDADSAKNIKVKMVNLSVDGAEATPVSGLVKSSYDSAGNINVRVYVSTLTAQWPSATKFEFDLLFTNKETQKTVTFSDFVINKSTEPAKQATRAEFIAKAKEFCNNFKNLDKQYSKSDLVCKINGQVSSVYCLSYYTLTDSPWGDLKETALSCGSKTSSTNLSIASGRYGVDQFMEYFFPSDTEGVSYEVADDYIYFVNSTVPTESGDHVMEFKMNDMGYVVCQDICSVSSEATKRLKFEIEYPDEDPSYNLTPITFSSSAAGLEDYCEISSAENPDVNIKDKDIELSISWPEAGSSHGGESVNVSLMTDDGKTTIASNHSFAIPTNKNDVYYDVFTLTDEEYEALKAAVNAGKEFAWKVEAQSAAPFDIQFAGTDKTFTYTMTGYFNYMFSVDNSCFNLTGSPSTEEFQNTTVTVSKWEKKSVTGTEIKVKTDSTNHYVEYTASTQKMRCLLWSGQQEIDPANGDTYTGSFTITYTKDGKTKTWSFDDYTFKIVKN